MARPEGAAESGSVSPQPCGRLGTERAGEERERPCCTDLSWGIQRGLAPWWQRPPCSQDTRETEPQAEGSTRPWPRARPHQGPAPSQPRPIFGAELKLKWAQCLPVLSHGCQKRVIACRPSVTRAVLHLGEAWARPAGLETWGGSCGRKHLSWNRINKTLTTEKIKHPTC